MFVFVCVCGVHVNVRTHLYEHVCSINGNRFLIFPEKLWILASMTHFNIWSDTIYNWKQSTHMPRKRKAGKVCHYYQIKGYYVSNLCHLGLYRQWLCFRIGSSCMITHSSENLLRRWFYSIGTYYELGKKNNNTQRNFISQRFGEWHKEHKN